MQRTRTSLTVRGAGSRWLHVALPVAILLTACGRPDPGGGAFANSQGSSRGGGSAPDARLDAQPADSDPCAWISLDQAKGVLGAAPVKTQRVRGVDNAEPEAKGRACQYDLAETAPDGSHARLILAVDPTGNLAVEHAGKIVNERLAKDAPGLGGVDTAVATAAWDASVWNIDVYHGRKGSLAVEVGTPDWGAVKVDRGKVERLAALVRDKVPDRPFAAGHSSQSPDGDPCSLVSRGDVEALVGPLKLAPFRSSNGDPVYERGGSSCSYWLGNHRALTIGAEWSNGKQLFKMATMMGNLVDSRLGLTGASADTLEGAWDQAATASGALVVLKGDRMLSVGYLPAGVDIGVAARVANRAMATLMKQ